MRRTAALALALLLLLLAGCGGAERAPVPAETAEAYALESFELAGIPAVSGGAVYDCAGGSGAEVWPEAGAPLDAPEGVRATALASGGGDGVWTLDRYWDADGTEHVELCLHRPGGGCESFEPDWPGEVAGMGATESGVNLKYRDRGEVKFANLSPDGALTPRVGGGPGATGAGDAHAGAYG